MFNPGNVFKSININRHEYYTQMSHVIVQTNRMQVSKDFLYKFFNAETSYVFKRLTSRSSLSEKCLK